MNALPIAPAPAAAAQAAAPAGRVATSPPTFGAVLERRTIGAGAPSIAAPAAPGWSTIAATGLEAIERARARIDALVSAGRSGRTFSAHELLALQGEAYRYGQAVELASRLVEHGAQAIKQALHAQA